jgi:S1-C subfamily serine protease
MMMQSIRARGVVKIFSETAIPSLIKPWAIDHYSHTGSGFIIGDRLIATNAHVADHGKVVTLRKQADGRRFRARVIAMASQVDLAFITVDDEEFWLNALVLQISSELVHFQDQVHVIGYPTGGDSICITEGVVSRIDWDRYCESGSCNLSIQVDAAINAGNSGGPCLFNGKVCGVAFQSAAADSGLQNVGYIIPSSILIKMVAEVSKVATAAEGIVLLREFGELSASFQNLENPYMKRVAALPAGKTGVLINRVSKFGWLEGILSVGDILESIDDIPVGDDGKVAMPELEGGRIDFRILVTSKLVGDEIKLGFYRAGEPHTATAHIGAKVSTILTRPHYGCYYMFAGLVFTPLSLVQAATKFMFISDEMLNSSVEIVMPHAYRHQQSVVVSDILPHEMNQGHREQIAPHPLAQLESVNGVKIYHMSDLVDTVDRLGAEKAEWVTFTFVGGMRFSFPLSEALEATGELMKDNNITKCWDKIEAPAERASTGDRSRSTGSGRT